MHQLLHDLAVDVLTDLPGTWQMEKAAAGDTSDMFTECQLGLCNERKVTGRGVGSGCGATRRRR